MLSSPGPYGQQVAEQMAALNDESAEARAVAAESLGFLRAYDAEAALIARLQDQSQLVRRAAALALAWCGGRQSVPSLLDALHDKDWLTRQSAHVALTNLTGMEFPFDAAAPADQREAEMAVWRNWWATVRPNETPAQITELIASVPRPWLHRHRLTASSTYRGPLEVLLDGALGPRYWQTKNVPFPQSLTIDVGAAQEIGQVVVHQYGPRFVMTDYSLEVSEDNEHFQPVVRRKQRSPVRLVLDVGGKVARYIRLTSYASANPVYPTTFFEVEVHGPHLAQQDIDARDEMAPGTWRPRTGDCWRPGSFGDDLWVIGRGTTNGQRIAPHGLGGSSIAGTLER